MGKRKKRKSNVGTIIMIIVIVLLSLFVYLLATKRIDFNNKNDDLVEDNTNIDNNKNNSFIKCNSTLDVCYFKTKGTG